MGWGWYVLFTMGRFQKLETAVPAEAGVPAADRKPVEREDGPAVPGYDQGHYQREGDRLFYSGEFQKALRAYSRSMQIDHSLVEPWLGQVLALLMLKQHREALMWVLRALELFPDDPRLVSLQGLTMALTGSGQRALACSDFAVTKAGQTAPFVWAIRAQILSLNDNPNAAACYDKARENNSDQDWKTSALLGMLLGNEKKWLRAVDFLEPAVAAQPSNGYLWKKLGVARERLGLVHRAIEAYNAALNLNPGDREAQGLLARVTTLPLPVRLWRRMFARHKP